MFKNLLQFWQGKDFIQKVLEDFKSMLIDAEKMFRLVCNKLVNNKEVPELKEKIYSLDKKINALEKDIRRRVIEHLALQPSVDVSTSLLLMSVVKDAERLGDYCKNLYEVVELLDKPISKDKYTEWFSTIDVEIMGLFQRAKKAFIESDEAQATKSWVTKREVSKQCEEILLKLSKSNLSVNEAVCFTLMARHFKRLSSHLTNIATSVIVPLSDLDYFDEKRDG